MGRNDSTNGRPAITIIGIGRMGISAIKLISRMRLLNVKYVGIEVDNRKTNRMGTVNLIGCNYPTTVSIFEKLLRGTDLLIAIHDSHDAFVASRSRILATVAKDSGVLSAAIVREPYLYARPLSMEDTEYVTVFPISDKIKIEPFIVNVVKAIVKPMTLDGLCGFDLADTATIFRKGKIAYGGFAIDEHEIESAAEKAVDQLTRIYPNMKSAVGGQANIETGTDYSWESIRSALDIVYDAAGGQCEFYWQHRSTETPSAPAVVSLIAVYEQSQI